MVVFLQAAPEDPLGVLMGLQDTRPVYIGKAKNLAARLANYFAAGVQKDAKTTRLRERARSLVVVEVDTHALACLLEVALIRRLEPHLNRSSTGASRLLFFVREGNTIRVERALPRPAARATFSTSLLQIQSVFMTLAAVSRALECDAPYSLFHGRRFRDVRVFSPREFVNSDEDAEALLAFFTGRPALFLSRVRERMKKEALRENFLGAARWRDALFTLKAFALQLARSRRILRRFRRTITFACGEVRVGVQGFALTTLHWADGTAFEMPFVAPLPRNLRMRLALHYEALRMMDGWAERGDEGAQWVRPVPRNQTPPRLPSPHLSGRKL